MLPCVAVHVPWTFLLPELFRFHIGGPCAGEELAALANAEAPAAGFTVDRA